MYNQKLCSRSRRRYIKDLQVDYNKENINFFEYLYLVAIIINNFYKLKNTDHNYNCFISHDKV
jgi:hypothetical protein